MLTHKVSCFPFLMDFPKTKEYMIFKVDLGTNFHFCFVTFQLSKTLKRCTSDRLSTPVSKHLISTFHDVDDEDDSDYDDNYDDDDDCQH